MPIVIPPKKPDVSLGAPVDQCIYCGAKDPAPLARFTDEHVFPEALGGNLVLERASCDTCQKIINKQVETPFLRTSWGDFRLKHNFPSKGAKRKNKSPRRDWVEVGKLSGGTMRIPIKDFPVGALILRYGTADVLAEGQVRGPDRLGSSAVGGVEPADIEACKAKYPDWDETMPMRGDSKAFARLLAKIAYGFVAGHAGTSWFREWVTPVILGRDEDYERIVGGDAEGYQSMNLPGAPGGEMGIRFYIRRMGDSHGLVVTEVDFFAEPSAPHYHVVLGECDLLIDPETNAYTWHTTPEALIAGGHVSIERDRSDMQVWMSVGESPPTVKPQVPTPPISTRPAGAVLPGLPGGPPLA